MHRVVITGIGIFSCLGNGVDAVSKSLREGRSGIGIDPRRMSLGYRSPLTGILPEINTKEILDRKSRLRFSEHGVYAYIAVREALAMAGMSDEFIKSNEIGLIFGNDSSAHAVIEGVDTIRAKNQTILVGSGNVFQSMNSTITMNLGVSLGISGINFTISAACASSSHALGIAAMLIRTGAQERIICGGAQEVNEYSVGSFDGISAFSIRVGDPTRASRPFDQDRDGLVPSGGGAALILESYESAVERGATILAELCGYGFSSGSDHLTIPSIDAPCRAMQRALADAETDISEIGYINAHATSTKVGDANEARALTKLLGDAAATTPVTSTKSMTGHELWMAGASEVIYSMLMMQGGFVAPNINLENCDDAAKSLYIPTQTIEKQFNAFLSNSFGFGGTNSALVIKKFKS